MALYGATFVASESSNSAVQRLGRPYSSYCFKESSQCDHSSSPTASSILHHQRPQANLTGETAPPTNWPSLAAGRPPPQPRGPGFPVGCLVRQPEPLALCSQVLHRDGPGAAQGRHQPWLRAAGSVNSVPGVSPDAADTAGTGHPAVVGGHCDADAGGGWSAAPWPGKRRCNLQVEHQEQ